jgi:hypothetical protein
MTWEDFMKLDHILLGATLDTPESMVRAMLDFDQYWKENPRSFESVFEEWVKEQWWYKPQTQYELEVQQDSSLLRTNYFLWKLDVKKLRKPFRKTIARVLKTRRGEGQ